MESAKGMIKIVMTGRFELADKFVQFLEVPPKIPLTIYEP